MLDIFKKVQLGLKGLDHKCVKYAAVRWQYYNMVVLHFFGVNTTLVFFYFVSKGYNIVNWTMDMSLY